MYYHCLMGMLDQLDIDAVKRLYRADLPVPVDVLNLIHFKDEDAYKWYGLLTLPLLKAVGGEVGWAGVHADSFLGEPRAEEILVVRYRNQRRFFALVLNPYYMGIVNFVKVTRATNGLRRALEWRSARWSPHEL